MSTSPCASTCMDSRSWWCSSQEAFYCCAFGLSLHCDERNGMQSKRGRGSLIVVLPRTLDLDYCRNMGRLVRPSSTPAWAEFACSLLPAWRPCCKHARDSALRALAYLLLLGKGVQPCDGGAFRRNHEAQVLPLQEQQRHRPAHPHPSGLQARRHRDLLRPIVREALRKLLR